VVERGNVDPPGLPHLNVHRNDRGQQCASQPGVDWLGIGAGGMKPYHFEMEGKREMSEISDHISLDPEQRTVRVSTEERRER